MNKQEFDQITVQEGFVPPPQIKTSRSFPVSDWDRYNYESFLGEGGMGRVFKAYDPRLKRHVALKFIRGDDPDMTQRFFLEAQAQARVEHEHVCKVYEVGEVQGHPYIAMQFINGESLKDAAQKMTLEQKVSLLADVAQGLHAAHRIGLIHRDIKPSNILVERDEQGLSRPFVMDFGLAREINETGQTLTGMIVGTPSYMPPEQALGQIHRLDRRADVYSLGATIYELLAGLPPFVGKSSIEIALKVVRNEPEPIRKINKQIPLDLETIVMKCLEKEPARRYDSARALAEDLRRFLDGEPIKARQTSLFYKISKKTRKHKAVAAILSLSLIIVVLLGGLGLNAWYMAAEQTAIAQQFGQEIKDVEWMMRVAYMFSIHNTQQDKVIVKEKMAGIETRMKQIGRASKGPGHYALGRGYLALRDYENARIHLDSAWQSGYQTDEVALSLGQVMGEIYHTLVLEANRIGNKERRNLRKQEIEKTYREPALKYLRESRQFKSASPAYIEGLISFYEGKNEVALQKAEQACEQVYWLYEGKQLAGDIYLTMGSEKKEKGEYLAAKNYLDRAGEFYQQAISIAPSDANNYTREAERWLQIMDVDMWQGGQIAEPFEKLIKVCDMSLIANPEIAEAFTKKAGAYRRMGQYQNEHGENPLANLESCIKMAEQALLLNSQDLNAYKSMANAYKIRSEYETGHGINPIDSLDHAIQISKAVIAINPNDENAHSALGNIYERRAEYEVKHGLPPQASFQQATESFEKAISLRPNFSSFITNQGNVFWIQGDYESRSGIDPHATLNRAIKDYEKALQLNTGDADSYVNLGITYYTIAEYELCHGDDPTLRLNDGRAALQKAAQINATDYVNYLTQTQLEIIAARWALRQGQSPKTYFQNAETALTDTIKLSTEDAEIFRSQAEFYLRKAEWQLKEKANIQSEIEAGLYNVEKALSIDRDMAEAEIVRGNLYLLQARAQQQPARQRPAAKLAYEYLSKAMDKNSLLRKKYEPLLNEARQLMSE